MEKRRRYASSISLSSSASDSLRMSCVLVFSFLAMRFLLSHRFAGDETGRDGQLVGGQAHRLPRRILAHAGDLVYDAARLHDGDPELYGALAGALPRLQR